jgi:ribose transport system substrate-binding protein
MMLGFSLFGCSAPAATTTEAVAAPSATGARSTRIPRRVLHGHLPFGHRILKGCYKGFEAACELYGVKTIYAGAAEYDVNQAVTVFEQIIANKPAVLRSPASIRMLMSSPSRRRWKRHPGRYLRRRLPEQRALLVLATGNKAAGAMAANYLASALGEKGDVALVTLPGQLNHESAPQDLSQPSKQIIPT